MVSIESVFQKYLDGFARAKLASSDPKIAEKEDQFKLSAIRIIARGQDADELIRMAESQGYNEILGQHDFAGPREHTIRLPCSCGGRVIVVPDRAEFMCDVCGSSTVLEATVFKDDQFFSQECQRTKHSNYDTSRHYKYWIDRLQAVETTHFTQAEIQKIKNVIESDKYSRATLNCEQMREILRDPRVRMTRANDHTTLLIQLCGGPSPPSLSPEELKYAAARFRFIMRLYDGIVRHHGNKPYYLYFMFKVFDDMFPRGHEKRRILKYIHFQSRDTIIKNDSIYRQICEQSGGILKYRATDPVSI